MSYDVPIAEARKLFPEFTFRRKLTPSAQKCAFEVVDSAGQSLCLKMISPNHATSPRLGREIKAMAKIDHPNLVKLVEYSYKVTSAGEEHYILERFIEGEDLQLDGLSSSPIWDTAEAVEFFCKILDGLDVLHKAKIVHRDLKPDNVRVNTSGEPIVIDLGLARHLELTSLTATSDGARIGTMLYFAPEQWQGDKRDIDARTDHFAVGIMLYQALVGKHPFYDSSIKTRDQLQKAVCEPGDQFNLPAFTRLDSKVQLVLRKLLAPKRMDRLASAEQAAKLLRKALK